MQELTQDVVLFDKPEVFYDIKYVPPPIILHIIRKIK